MRDAFPDLAVPSYLNFAAVGPPARQTLDAVVAATRAQSAAGIGAIGPWLQAQEAGRAEAAALLGGAAEDVALVHSTGEGLGAVAWNLDWRARDRVVLLRGEFPTNVLPWLAVARAFDLDVTWLDAGDFLGPSGRGLQTLRDAVRGGVRVVAVSAVQFQTGLRMPLAEMAAITHAAGGELCVDAIQALGVVPLHDTGADWIAAGGHKWLMAPCGTGLLWGRPSAWARLTPRTAGWLSVEQPLDFLAGAPGLLRYDKPVLRGPPAIEGSNRNHPGLVGLAVALRLARDADPARTLGHIAALHDAAEPALVELGFTSARSPVLAQRSGILALRPPPRVDLHRLVAALAARGVSVASPDGHLRVSPSWPTSPAEIDLLVEALRDGALREATG